MAALDEDTAPDLDIFEGRQWEDWASAMHSTTKKHTDVKKTKNPTEVSKLKRSDIKLFGHCPARDKFFLVICDYCGHPVKPQALRLHIEKYHKSKKIYVKTSSKSKGQKSSIKNHKISLSSSVQYSSHHSSIENDKTQRSIVSCGPTSKAGIILRIAHKQTHPSDTIALSSPSSVKSSSSAESIGISHPKVSILSKQESQNIKKSSSHTSPLKTSSHLQESPKHYTKASKDLYKILNNNTERTADNSNSKHMKNIKKNLTSHSNPLHSKQDNGSTSSSIENMHKKSHSYKQHSKKSPASDPSPSAIKSQAVEIDSNANKVPNIILPPKKKNIPIKDRQYDPNKHCGVNFTKGEESLPCRRSLTCKNHSLSAKRNVLGRKKTFDQLLSEHSANNKSRLIATERELKPTTVLLTPQPPAAVSSSDKFLAPTPPLAKVRPSKSKAQALGSSSTTKPSASLIPKIFSPWHVDCWDSDSDNSDEAPLLNEVNYIPRHPVPLVVCPSESFLANTSLRKLNRRLGKLSNEFICKTSSKNKTIAAFQPRFCAVSNASYTINHIKHSVECSAQHCAGSIVEQSTVANPNILLTHPSSCASNKHLVNSSVAINRTTTFTNTSINMTQKRTKIKPAKRKSSMTDLNQAKVPVSSANNLLRNRSKSVNLHNYNYNSHEILGSRPDVGSTVLKNLLTSGKIIPKLQMQNFGHGQMPSLLTSDSNNATVGSYTVINPGQLSTAGKSMHAIQMPSGKARTASMPQNRNAKGQFVDILKNANHNIAINCDSMENVKIKPDEAIHINGLSVSTSNDLMNWRTNGPLSTAMSNPNSVDLTADDIDKTIQQTV